MSDKPESLIFTWRGLKAGLGVEDIAVRSGHAVEVIRNHVSGLRNAGALAVLYRPKGKKA